MPRVLQYLFGFLIAALLVVGPLGYAWYCQSQVRNLRVVRDGILYRSGQMSLAGLRRVVHDYGIKTVVSLRDGVHAGDPPPDLAEEEYCKAEELNYCRISPRSWWSDEGPAPAAEGVRQFQEVMDRPDNYPVLIHCLAGIHRSGAFCALYRMEYEHWNNQRALSEMRSCGYVNLDEEMDILTFLADYRPRWRGLADPADFASQRKIEAKPVKNRKQKLKKFHG